MCVEKQARAYAGWLLERFLGEFLGILSHREFSERFLFMFDRFLLDLGSIWVRFGLDFWSVFGLLFGWYLKKSIFEKLAFSHEKTTKIQ